MRPILRSLLYGGLATLTAGLSPLARAADFQIENVRLGLGAITVSAPRIEVKGSTLEREAFRAALDGSSGESAVIRMGKLDASEILIPELLFEQTVGPQKQTTTYRGLRFQAVGGGKVGRGEAASGALAASGAPTGPIAGTFQATRFEGLDIRHAARVLTESARPGTPETMQPLFARFEQDGYALDMGEAGKISLGKTIGRDFSAKVGEEPLYTLFNRLMELAAEQDKTGAAGKPDAAKAAEAQRLGLAMLSVYESISYGSGESRDLSIAVSAPPKPGARPEPVSISIARIAYGADAPGGAGFGLEGFAFAGGGAKGSIASISHVGFSLTSVIAELKAMLAKPDADLEALDFRRFIPALGTTRMTGLDVLAPQEALPGQAKLPPVKLGLDLFEFRAGEPLNGVPTSLGLSVEGLKAPVVAGPNNPAAKDLLAMGYKLLNLSAKLDLAWDQAKSELGIRSLSLGGADMATFEAKGTLGNVTKDLFSQDLALAQVAALGATARSVEARLQNFGLFEKLVENEARKARRKPEDMRREYAMIASLGLAAMLGPSDAAKTLTSAIARFVAKPGTLTVQARAKAGGGLGLADVITLTDPTEIFDKIDLQANAE
ncbi:MAG: hypothetical protein ACK4VM_11295 [Bosea sp. (in: a-proteobacteria)]